MSVRVASLLAIGAIACRGAPPPPLYAAGTTKDEGHGMLARASAKLLTSDEAAPPLFPERAQAPAGHDDGYGGSTYGGSAYGGASYATYTVQAWSHPSPNRLATFNQKPGLAAAIEGTITWRGPIPKATTACGAIAPLRIGNGRSVGGIVVYIERVSVGRVLPHGNGEQRPLTVGGVIVKRGCALVPTMQIVTPVPAALAIHGDARRTRVQVTGPGGASQTNELQEGGRVALQLAAGATRVESEDGTLAAAWVLAIDTPSYAITDDAGRFRIDELAAGTYELTIVQPPIPTVTDGKLGYGPPVTLRRTITVDAARPARLDIVLGR